MTAFIDAAGWTLVHFLWQGAAIAAVAAVGLRLLRGGSPQARYALACVGAGGDAGIAGRPRRRACGRRPPHRRGPVQRALFLRVAAAGRQRGRHAAVRRHPPPARGAADGGAGLRCRAGASAARGCRRW